MANAQLRDMAEQWFHKSCTQGDLNDAKIVFAPNFVYHAMDSGTDAGIDWVTGAVKSWREDDPGLQFRIHDLLVDGDKVAVRWEASGKKRRIRGLGIGRMVNGQIAEYWEHTQE